MQQPRDKSLPVIQLIEFFMHILSLAVALLAPPLGLLSQSLQLLLELPTEQIKVTE